MSDNKLYITSTLPYSNGVCHIGHLFEFVLTDALAKYNRIIRGKENVFFNTGLDEEGLKIWEKAKELDIPIEEYLENNAKDWKEFCTKFQIDYDNFYRTSSETHQIYVKAFWSDCLRRGDIYKQTYSGTYCKGCESFKTDKDLIDGKCPDHPTIELKVTNEENYFFRLSKYKFQLSSWINAHPDFLSPKNKLEELKNLINDAEDISISRLKSNVPWGTEVPDDKDHIIYVWFSALTNYVFSCGYTPTPAFENKNKRFHEWWENTIQVCGPDNIRFQAVIFQGILASAGIEQTGKLLVHGTILDKDGNKMSKTTGNVIDPIEQLNKFGIDYVRYYCLAGLNTYENSSWAESDLIELCNAHLANEFGNLITRTLHLINLKNISLEGIRTSGEFWRTVVNDYVPKINDLWENYSIKEALHETNQLVKLANKYMNDEAPWSKECKNPSLVLHNLVCTLYELHDLYLPVFSKEKSAELKTALDTNTKIILFPKIEKEVIVHE